MAVSVVNLGSDRWLFVDRTLMETERGTTLRLHPPVRREVVWRPDRQWEGDVSWFPHVIREGDRYRLWYWARRGPTPGAANVAQAYGAYMESPDGIHWERPGLGLVPFEGSTHNNLLWPLPGHGDQNLAVFKDTNPDVAATERYKALLRGAPGARGLWGTVSPPSTRRWPAGSSSRRR